jgi:hypothetical protein
MTEPGSPKDESQDTARNIGAAGIASGVPRALGKPQ